MCVTTCPTGIDIRGGLQMECVGCAQCIDACDAVMMKIGRPKGLIRYSSQAAMETGERRLVRPRIVLYPLVLIVIVVAFTFVLTHRADADVTLLREGSQPYRTLADGSVANDVRIKIVNRSNETRTYRVGISGLDHAAVHGETEVTIAEGDSSVARVEISAPRQAFHLGKAVVVIEVEDDAAFETTLRFNLQGPWNAAGRITEPNGSKEDQDAADEGGES